MTDTQVVEDTTPVQDTVVTQQNEASVQSSEAPEATQGTGVEETPTTEVSAEDTAEERLYAGKYKSVEEMEKAYKELNTKSTRDAMEKAELTRILNESFAAPQPAQAVVEQDDFVEEPDPVNQEIDSLKKVTAVQSFVMTHPDADAASMQKVLQDDPMVKQITGHEAKLEYAFLKSQAQGHSKAVSEAVTKAAQETTTKIAEKQNAQVETATSAEKTDGKSELLDSIANASTIEERDQALRSIIRKHLV